MTFVFLFVASIIGKNMFNYLCLIIVLPSVTKVVVRGCEVQIVDAFGVFKINTKDCLQIYQVSRH